jgi:ABC-type uncharacterized transport system permease subunit
MTKLLLPMIAVIIFSVKIQVMLGPNLAIFASKKAYHMHDYRCDDEKKNS